jgi:hypothetical protein
MSYRRYELACEVDDGIEALEYWRRRRERLPWRRRAARREAELMMRNWERRLVSAALRDSGLTVAERIDAGLSVVRGRGSLIGRRWRRRAAMAAFVFGATAVAGFAALAALLF